MRVLSLFLILFGLTAWAGEGHNHEAAIEPAPHGGILRDATPYKAELVLNGELAKIYVYTKDAEVLKTAAVSANELTGYVRFPKQKKNQPVVFKKSGDSFETKISGISKVHRFDMHVTLEEAGTKTLLDFGIDNIN
jgi:hypothetical protein